jgi:thiol-disulfide isomerase/thioredoxin
MKKIVALLLVSVGCLPSTTFCQQPAPIIIRAHLKAKQGIPLNYLDKHDVERGILLKNTTIHDTIITRTFTSDIPVELQKRIYLNNRGVKQSFLAQSGDNVDLWLEGEHMIEPNSNKLFPQDYLAYIDPFKRTIMKPFEQYAGNELKSYYDESNQIYKSNSLKIDSLKQVKHISAQILNFFVNTNKMDRYIRIMEPFARPGIFERIGNQFVSVDEIKQIRDFTHTFSDYKTIELTNLLSALIDYDLSKYKIDPVNLPEVVNFILGLGYGNRGCNIAFQRIINYQDKASPFIVAALNMLRKKTYIEQLPDIDAALLTYQNRNKNFAHPENVKLKKPSGRLTSLDQVFKANKGKLILLDFWASWCIPCRQQIRLIRQLDEKYKNEKIRFISISLDFDAANINWLAALKHDGNLAAANQYRLINDKQSGFTGFYRINTIPRYILIGANGEVIESDFYNPLEKKFEATLISELAKLRE